MPVIGSKSLTRIRTREEIQGSVSLEPTAIEVVVVRAETNFYPK